MKSKFSTSVFTAWAALFMMVLIVDSRAAWYEWTTAAKEKLEWKKSSVECLFEAKLVIVDDTEIWIGPGVKVDDDTEYAYIVERGEKFVCSEGKEYADCADIVGVWESWDREGECLPKESVSE